MTRSLRPACVLAVLLAAVATTALAETKDPPRRDEFGLVPEDAHDKDLMLPDPVLDRTWPGPKPGEGRAVQGTDEPEGDADRPSIDGEPAPRLPRRRKETAEDPVPPPRPKPRVIGPDGHRDPGSPAPEIDADLPDVLDRDAPDLSDLEREEARPSVFERGGNPNDEPAGEPGDIQDSGPAGE